MSEMNRPVKLKVGRTSPPIGFITEQYGIFKVTAAPEIHDHIKQAQAEGKISAYLLMYGRIDYEFDSEKYGHVHIKG